MQKHRIQSTSSINWQRFQQAGLQDINVIHKTVGSNSHAESSPFMEEIKETKYRTNIGNIIKNFHLHLFCLYYYKKYEDN